MAVHLALYYFFGEEVMAQALQDSEFFEDVKDQKHYHFQIWTKTFHENWHENYVIMLASLHMLNKFDLVTLSILLFKL